MIATIDVIVIGAGVVGLAAARSLAQAGREVLVVEKEAAIGLHTSSRNSEVIHAGIYYQPQSLKARLCVKGKRLLYDYCAKTGVAALTTGKLIVAQSPAELPKLMALQQNAIASDVNDLVWLSGAEAMALEPELRCAAALLSPSTGIIDSGQLMLTLRGDAESHGAIIALQSEVMAGAISDTGIMLDIKGADGERFEIMCHLLINSAGHGAHDIASALDGYDNALLPPKFLAKGTYCSVSGRSPFKHHIYPIPVQGGLGTHVTNDLDGIAKLGPDVAWIPSLNYDVDQNLVDAFQSACEGFWPGIRERDITPSYCGVRPKLSGPGEANADFHIQRVGEVNRNCLVNLFGIESPGLTSSLALGDYLLELG